MSENTELFIYVMGVITLVIIAGFILLSILPETRDPPQDGTNLGE